MLGVPVHKRYTRIKSEITKDLGANAFRNHRGDITAALVRQLSRRRGDGKRRRSANGTRSLGSGGAGAGSAASRGRRQLEVELKVLLERSAKESFDQLRVGLTPIDLLAGGEIISMSRTVKILGGNLALIKESFQDAYAQLPGMDLITMTAQHYDKLVATEVRELLFRWVPTIANNGVSGDTNASSQDGAAKESTRSAFSNTEASAGASPGSPNSRPNGSGRKQSTVGVLLNNIPAVVLRLYKSVRAFWQIASSSLEAEFVKSLELSDFQNWFFPFALDWIDESEFWAKQLIDNCMELDLWKPVSANNWFSSSVVDVFRVVYEILDVWDQIDWLDKVAREEVLMERLAEVLCSCVRHYIDKVSQRIDPRYFDGANLKKEPGAFYVDDDLCVALNNVTEVRGNVEKLFDFLELERVAEAHIELVRVDAERLSGGVLLEGNRMRLYSEDDDGANGYAMPGGGGGGIGGRNRGGGGNNRLIRPHPALKAFDLTYTKIDDYRMHLMGAISRAIASRVTRDVLLIFQRSGPGVEGCYKAVEMLNRGLLREVDELKLPSKRQTGGVEGNSGSGLFNSPSIRQTVRNRKGGKEQRSSELREDGYLFVNLWIIGAKVGPRFSDDETRNATLKAVWEAVVSGLTGMLCSFNSKGKGMQVFTAATWRELVAEALATFRLFFNSGGDGVELGVLDSVTALILTPVFAQFENETSTLVAHFVSLASKVLDSVVYPQLGLEAPPLSVSGMQGDGALVHGGACDSYVDEHPLGTVKLRLLSFDSVNTRRGNVGIGGTADAPSSDSGSSLSSGAGGGSSDGGQVKSVRITLVGCTGIVATQNVYLSASLFAAETGMYRTIFKSKTVKEFEDSSLDFEDEGFTVPDCTADLAVQVRAHSTGGFLTWNETILGEVLLDLAVVSSVGNEIDLTLPFQPLVYAGYAGK